MPSNRTVGRRYVLKTLGVSTLAPALAGLSPVRLLALGYHPMVPAQEGMAWAPRFLTRDENETVVVLSELIIPATDTPGARAALVNQYVDFVLSDAEPAVQDGFRRGLAWLQRASRARHGQAFRGLTPDQQTALLASVAEPGAGADAEGVRFFREIRQLTIDGYYGSEIGMFDELDFQGNTFVAEFEGCTHPEHLNWEPAAARPAEPDEPDEPAEDD